MTYRAAARDTDGVVVCIALDDNQSGSYLEGYTWQGFTFTSIPDLASDVMNEMNSHGYRVSGLKVSGGSIVLRTLSEVQAEYAG